MTSGARIATVGALLALLVPLSAAASGITLGRFGGLHGHPNADGGLALYWNPGLLSLDSGFFFTIDGLLVFRLASIDREATDPGASPDVLAANTGEAELSNLGLIGYGAVGYTFAFESCNLSLAIGVLPAYGGRAEWDKNTAAPAQFPGAVDGPQRWSAIESTFSLLHYTGAVSVTLPDVGLSLGLGIAYVDGKLDTVRARNLNRTDDLVDADGNLLEGRVHLHGEDQAVAFTAGFSYALDNVRASFTYRSAYTLTLIGPVRQAYATNEPTTVTAFLEFPLPHVFQTALTVDFGQLVVTGITDFTAWSIIEENDALTEASRERLLLIPRDLDNTLSVRAIVGWQFSDAFELSGTVGFDPSAVPVETLDASLFDAPKVQVGMGIRYEVGHWRVLTSYVHDILFPVESTGNRHEPAMNGRFTDTRGFLNLSVEGRF